MGDEPRRRGRRATPCVTESGRSRATPPHVSRMRPRSSTTLLRVGAPWFGAAASSPATEGIRPASPHRGGRPCVRVGRGSRATPRIAAAPRRAATGPGFVPGGRTASRTLRSSGPFPLSSQHCDGPAMGPGQEPQARLLTSMLCAHPPRTAPTWSRAAIVSLLGRRTRGVGASARGGGPSESTFHWQRGRRGRFCFPPVDMARTGPGIAGAPKPTMLTGSGPLLPRRPGSSPTGPCAGTAVPALCFEFRRADHTAGRARAIKRKQGSATTTKGGSGQSARAAQLLFHGLNIFYQLCSRPTVARNSTAWPAPT